MKAKLVISLLAFGLLFLGLGLSASYALAIAETSNQASGVVSRSNPGSHLLSDGITSDMGDAPGLNPEVLAQAALSLQIAQDVPQAVIQPALNQATDVNNVGDSSGTGNAAVNVIDLQTTDVNNSPYAKQRKLGG